jgi:hypothetical protein
MASADSDLDEIFDKLLAAFRKSGRSVEADVDAMFQKIVRPPYYGQMAFKYLRNELNPLYNRLYNGLQSLNVHTAGCTTGCKNYAN